MASSKNKQVQLGASVEDIVTGFKGITVSRTEYLNGCVRWCVQPKVKKDGSEVEGVFFDGQQLKVVTTNTAAAKIVQAETGGTRPSPRGPREGGGL